MSVDISDIPWAECNIVENRQIYVSDSLGLKRKKRGKGLHRYEFELVTIEMNDSDDQAFEVEALISDAYDQEMVFKHPRRSYTRGTEPAIGIITNNDYAAGLRDIAFKSTQAWQLKAGDYIRFISHTKVYRLAKSTTLTTGVQVVRLTDPLLKPIQSETAVIVNDVEWLLQSDSKVEISTVASENQDVQLVLNCVEVI